eukprot:565767-Pyramimonas_sp.AAC.1
MPKTDGTSSGLAGHGTGPSPPEAPRPARAGDDEPAHEKAQPRRAAIEAEGGLLEPGLRDVQRHELALHLHVGPA